MEIFPAFSFCLACTSLPQNLPREATTTLTPNNVHTHLYDAFCKRPPVLSPFLLSRLRQPYSCSLGPPKARPGAIKSDAIIRTVEYQECL